MIPSKAFWNAVDKGVDRINESQRQAARAAIKLGCKVLSCGRYYVGGPLVLELECPEGWKAMEAWARCKSIKCTIPADKEAETLAWANARMAA